MKQLIIITLFFVIAFNKLNAQNNPPPNCPPDGKIEYDAFESMVLDLSKKSGIDILPNYDEIVELCKNDADQEKCLRDHFKWVVPTREPEEKEIEIDNGITIVTSFVPEIEPDKSNYLGFTENRHPDPDEDLHTCCGETSKGFFFDLTSASDINLHENMKYLFDAFSLEGPLGPVIEEYLYKFKNKTGGPGVYHFNKSLSTYVWDTPEMKNFLKKAGFKIQSELKKYDGNINSINNKPIKLTEQPNKVFGPQWEGFSANLDGTHILIGNTEQSFVYLLRYEYKASTKEWEGDFYFKITDNWGLDMQDCTELNWMKSFPLTNPLLLGFESWWNLQHPRCYTPFITDIRIFATLKGKL